MVKLGAVERETAALRQHLEVYAHVYTSRLSAVEVPRALARKETRSERATEHIYEMLEGVSIIELDEAMSRVAASLGPPARRSLDAIHLASALSIRDELDAFVTYDVRLGEAARSLGLSVVTPA